MDNLDYLATATDLDPEDDGAEVFGPALDLPMATLGGETGAFGMLVLEESPEMEEGVLFGHSWDYRRAREGYIEDEG